MSDTETIRAALDYIGPNGATRSSVFTAAREALDRYEKRLQAAEQDADLQAHAYDEQRNRAVAAERALQAAEQANAKFHEDAAYTASVLDAEVAKLEQALQAAEQENVALREMMNVQPDIAGYRSPLQKVIELRERVVAFETALREIADRHPDAQSGEHPAVDIARAALRLSPAPALTEPDQAEAQGEAAASRSGQGSLDGNAQGSGSVSAVSPAPQEQP